MTMTDATTSPWTAWHSREQRDDGPRSVLQDWVMDLPRRFQGSILAGLRGCDLAPKAPMHIDERYGCSTGDSSPERGLAAFLRWCVLNAADLREIDVPGAWFQSKPPCNWKPSQFGHYPEHWYAHYMHSIEIVGYEHPDVATRHEACHIYYRFVRNLHLNPETRTQLWERMMEDRFDSGTVVS